MIGKKNKSAPQSKKRKELHAKVWKKDKYGDYMKKDTVEKLGVVNYDGDLFITRNAQRFAVYRLMFKNPNGIDVEMDIYNKGLVHEFINSLEHDFKILFVTERQNMLTSNIEFMKQRYRECDNVNMRKYIAHEIADMEIFNEEKQANTILFISEEDISVVDKLSDNLIMERYDFSKAQQLFVLLNNEME